MDRQALHSLVAAALDLVIHVTRSPQGKRWVQEIHVVEDGGNGLCQAIPALEFAFDGTAMCGPAYSSLVRLVG
jgi:pilus assembly protein CpaF